MRISAAMCTFNGAAFLEAQLESIAAQRRPPDELIVNDDRSRDETVVILEKFAARAPFPVDIVASKEHVGSTRNYERAIARCSGDVIVLSDQDDVWLPQKVERLEQVFAASSAVGLAFSDAYLIRQNGRRTGDRLWNIAGFTQRQRRRMRDDPFGQLMGRSIVSGCTLSFRADQRSLLIPFPPQQAAPGMRLIHDRWISIMLAAAGPVAVIDEPLVEYRIHPKQQVGIPRLQVRRVVPSSILRFRQVAVAQPLMRQRLLATIEHLGMVRERLRAAQDLEGRDDAIARVDECIHHLRARLDLPRNRVLRATGVLHEVASGRYRRFGLGLASAVADLGRSPRAYNRAGT